MKKQTRGEQNFNPTIFWLTGGLVVMVFIYLAFVYPSEAQELSSCDDFQVGDLVFVPGDQVNMFGVVVEKSEEIGACAWVKIGEDVYHFDIVHLWHAEVMRLDDDKLIVFQKDAVQNHIVIDDTSLCDEECQMGPTICEAVEFGYERFLNVTSVTILDVLSEESEWFEGISHFGGILGIDLEGVFIGFPNTNQRAAFEGISTEEICGEFLIPHNSFFEERRPCPTFPGEYTTLKDEMVSIRGGYMVQGECIVVDGDGREFRIDEFLTDPTEMPADFMGPCEAIGAFLEEFEFQDPYISFPGFDGYEFVNVRIGEVGLATFSRGGLYFDGYAYATQNGHPILVTPGPITMTMQVPLSEFCP